MRYLCYRVTPMPELTLFYWLTFTLDHDRAEALASFVRRFGRQPERVIEALGVLWVGPV